MDINNEMESLIEGIKKQLDSFEKYFAEEKFKFKKELKSAVNRGINKVAVKC